MNVLKELESLQAQIKNLKKEADGKKIPPSEIFETAFYKGAVYMMEFTLERLEPIIDTLKKDGDK